MRRAVLAVAALLAISTGAVPAARAFVRTDSFEQAALEGGGGGLYYTGSPADAVQCVACHVEDVPDAFAGAVVDVEGLPEGGVEPDRDYVLSLLLSGPAIARAGVALEVTAPDGTSVGQLSPIPAEDVTSADECDDGTAAVAVARPSPGRQVAAAGGCGAERFRVAWRSPATLPPGTILYAGLVVADGSSTATGDRAVQLERPLTEPDPAASRTTGAGCSAGPAPGARGVAPLALLALALCVVRRRRRGSRGRRRRRRR